MSEDAAALANLLDEARCLLIGPIRICTKGHLVTQRDADALAEQVVCGAGHACDGTLRRGFLLEGEDMHPIAIVAGLIAAIEQFGRDAASVQQPSIDP